MLFLELAAGLVLLVVGGDLLVRGAVAFAVMLRVSPLLIGLTVVGFGTSMPELATSLEAAFAGSPGIAIGNVVGSNTANILLILGIAAIIAPIPVARSAFMRDGTVAAFSALACLGVIMLGNLERLRGFALVAMLVGYVGFAARSKRIAHQGGGAQTTAKASLSGMAAAACIAGGLATMVMGARLLVQSAIDLAQIAGVSDTVIGLTVVAVGTSLPELFTSVVAAYRRAPDIAFGNVVGSNIYNVLGILGMTAIIHPIPVPEEIIRLDIWVMLAATAGLTAVACTGWRITRREGAALVLAYGLYVTVLTTG